jgi:hypothetical protein
VWKGGGGQGGEALLYYFTLLAIETHNEWVRSWHAFIAAGWWGSPALEYELPATLSRQDCGWALFGIRAAEVRMI